MNKVKKDLKEKIDLHIKRRTYVSTIGWVSSIISGLLIYFSLFGILNIVLFNSNPVIRSLSGSGFQEVKEDFFTVSFLVSISYLLAIAFGFLVLICSIGLLKYKDWARSLYIKVSWVLIGLTIVACIIYIFKSSEVLTRLIKNELGMNPEGEMSIFFKTIFGVQIVSFGILLIVLFANLTKHIHLFEKG